MYETFFAFGSFSPLCPDALSPFAEDEDRAVSYACASLLRLPDLSALDEENESRFAAAQEDMDALQQEFPSSFLPDLFFDPQDELKALPYFVVVDAALSCARRYGPGRVLSRLEDMRLEKEAV